MSVLYIVSNQYCHLSEEKPHASLLPMTTPDH